MSCETCEICAESISKRRPNVKCQFCDFSACTTCYKTYLGTVNKQGCMSQECKGEWSRAFIHANFPNSYISGELRDHQKEVMYQTQLGLMPETQLIIEAQNRRDDIRIDIYKLNIQKNDIAIKTRKIAECRYKSWNSDTQYKTSQLKETIENKWSNRCQIIDEECTKIKGRLDQKVRNEVEEKLKENDEYNKIVDTLTKLYAELGDTTTKKDRSQFIRKCGDPECRGLLSTRWKCGLCEKSTCNDCHELIKEDHICNPDNVATAKLLANDTKPCSKCQTPIFKIDGCDQMWCTQCHTGFSWKTGKIEMKLHNPHAYEWQRQNGGLARAQGDVPCGRVMDHFLASEINIRLRKLTTQIHIGNDERSKLVDAMTKTNEIIQRCVQLIAYERAELDTQHHTQTLRIRYLMKDLDDKDFKQKLIMLDTKYAKETEIRTITQLLTTTVTDIMYRFKDAITEDTYNPLILNEVDAIIEYVNQCLLDTKKVFKMAYILKFEKDILMTKIYV